MGAVVAFTPAVAEAADVGAARAIDVPVLIVGARFDQLTPWEMHAKRIVLREGRHHGHAQCADVEFEIGWLAVSQEGKGAPFANPVNFEVAACAHPLIAQTVVARRQKVKQLLGCLKVRCRRDM